MGNRAIIILKDSNNDFSPMIYLHWGGDNVIKYKELLEKKMSERPDDLDYATARMLGIICDDVSGNISVGCSNLDESSQYMLARFLQDKTERNQQKLMERLSHGDTGIHIIDISQEKFQYLNMKEDKIISYAEVKECLRIIDRILR